MTFGEERDSIVLLQGLLASDPVAVAALAVVIIAGIVLIVWLASRYRNEADRSV
jgi:hypothetical protein